MTEIWHNPRCSKSRQALARLEERGLKPDVVQYLKSPPTQKRLREVVKLLGGEASALVRKKEALYGELALEDATDKELIEAMATHPRLIERPVVITAKGARIGRPTESIDEVL